MMTESLETALTKLTGRLRAAGEPLPARLIIQELTEPPSIREIDLMEAIWMLIRRGTIRMTPERKLVYQGGSPAE